MRTTKNVLLLNASEEVLKMITWQKAVSLLVTGRARAPWNYDHHYDIKLKNSGVFKLPSALVLADYVNLPYRKPRLSRKNIFLRDGFRCQYTGERFKYSDLSMDHVIPSSKGGRHTWDNIVTCCKKVNNRKGDRTPEEAGLTLLRKPKMPTHAELAINGGNEDQREAWSRWIPKSTY